MSIASQSFHPTLHPVLFYSLRGLHRVVSHAIILSRQNITFLVWFPIACAAALYRAILDEYHAPAT